MFTLQEAKDIQSLANDLNAIDSYKRNFEEAYQKRCQTKEKCVDQTELDALKLKVLSDISLYSEREKYLVTTFIAIGEEKLSELRTQDTDALNTMSMIITQFTQLKNQIDTNIEYSKDIKDMVTATLIDFDTKYQGV